MSTQNDFCEPLIDDKHKTSACGYFRTSTEKNTKSAALFDSGNQKTKSSSISSGSNVKPYVSKRQKEKLAQAISSSLMANHPSQETDLTLRNSSLKGANYHPDDAKFLNRKGTDQVCKPSKKLHLNLKGHTQGVNCIRWNVTESNNHLLVSASMDRTVCVWDTRQGGACMQSLTCHTEAVKDAKKWSHCLKTVWRGNRYLKHLLWVYKQSCECTTLLYIMEILSKRQVIRWGKHNLVESIILYTQMWFGTLKFVCVWLRVDGWGKLILYINPLHPNISMYILHTDLHMFPKVLTRRIWLAM